MTAAVAFALVAIALFEGGYSLEARAVIGAVVWTAVLVGIGFGLIPRERPPKAALVSGALLAGLALLTPLSVIWSSDDGNTMGEAVRVSTYLGIFVLVVGCSGRGNARSWLQGLMIGIVLVALVAVATRAFPGLPGGDEELGAFLPAAKGRLSNPIGYWNALAAICALGGVLLTWFAVWAATLPGRAFAVAAMPLLGLAIYLTSSRGGVVALAVGSLMLLAIGPRRTSVLVSLGLGTAGTALILVLAKDMPELRGAVSGSETEAQGTELFGALVAASLFVGVARMILDGLLIRTTLSRTVARTALVAAGVIAAVAIVAGDPVERFREFKEVPESETREQDLGASHLTSGSGSGRWQFWGEALDAFGSEPLHGIGAGAYASYWNRNAPIDQVTGDAHSLYLEQLAELGVLGGVLAIAFVLFGPIASLKRGQPRPAPERAAAIALVAAGAVSAGLDWTWELTAAFAPVVVALALLSGPALGPGDESKGAQARPLLGWGVACLVVGWLSLLLAFDTLLTSRSLDASREAARDQDFSRAADDARSAIALQPWAAEPRLQLGLVQEAAGDLDAADESVNEASARARDDWLIWLVAARIATLDGRVNDAEGALAEARRLNPRAPLFSALDGPLETPAGAGGSGP